MCYNIIFVSLIDARYTWYIFDIHPPQSRIKSRFSKIYGRFQQSLLFGDSIGRGWTICSERETFGLLHLFLQNVVVVNIATIARRGTPFPTRIVGVWQLSGNVETMRRPEPPSLSSTYRRRRSLRRWRRTARGYRGRDSGGDSTAAAAAATAATAAVVAAAAVVRPFSRRGRRRVGWTCAGSQGGTGEREQLSRRRWRFSSCRGEPAARVEVLTGCLPSPGYLATVCGQHTYETLEIWL